MPRVRLGVGFSELFKLRNGNQGAIEMTEYIERFWRNATAADVARVMAGETVEARFSDSAHSVWSKVTQLAGAKRTNHTRTFWLSPNSNWRYCQVYAPDQWYLNKPEPGEGYRLLAKFPDEALQPGDEAFWPGVRWELSGRGERGETQLEGFWYRRRIEPPKPEPKHYVLQVGDTVETPAGYLLTITDRGYSAKAP